MVCRSWKLGREFQTAFIGASLLNQMFGYFKAAGVVENML